MEEQVQKRAGGDRNHGEPESRAAGECASGACGRALPGQEPEERGQLGPRPGWAGADGLERLQFQKYLDGPRDTGQGFPSPSKVQTWSSFTIRKVCSPVMESSRCMSYHSPECISRVVPFLSPAGEGATLLALTRTQIQRSQ